MTASHRRAVTGSLALLGLLVALLLSMSLASVARADFGFDHFTTRFQDPASNIVTQAGAHADVLTDFSMLLKNDPETGTPIPAEQLKDVVVDLPAGFYGNPNVGPRCSMAQLDSTAYVCPADAQVGVITQQIFPPTVPFVYSFPVYMMNTGDDETAELGANVMGVPIKIDLRVRTDGDYGLRASLSNLNQAVPLYATKLVLWGVPADSAHDAQRFKASFSPGAPSYSPKKPFITLPARCDEDLVTTMRADSWQHPGDWVSATSSSGPLTGCDKLEFAASIKARPSTPLADRPAGYDVDLTIPQEDSWSGIGTPPLKKAVVTLPQGVAISPASASGLGACTDDQIALRSTAEPTCPDASKIGTVRIDTPLLDNPLEGDIVLGQPTAGHLFRLFLVARGSGILLKLPGEAKPDPVTGQITTTFDDNPQLPFTNLHLHFKGGDRAPLVNPQTCGTKTTTAQLTPWAGPESAPTDSFDITGCTGGFAPSFEAGTISPGAGAFSPFTMTIRRNDGDPAISKIAVDLPPGVLGILAGIPQCPEAAAAAGTCDASTQLGTTTVEAGSGNQPLPLTGKVFLAGPYKGAPYSLSIVVQAIAGPFDLGTVVVRAPLNIDAAAGKVSVPADPLPTILQGIPLRLKTINITLDRPGFMFNATNCTPMTLNATITSATGAVATPSSRYQALGCGELPLNPKFTLTLSGRSQLKKGGHPGVVADLSQKPGQAGLKRVEVTLPSGVSVALPNLAIFCHKADADARKCPASSIVGQASAKTPALPAPLSGPVYLVEGSKKDPKTGKDIPTLPRLWLKLEGGGVPLDLWGDTDVVGGRVITTFATIPDAPIASFQLKINGGAKGILQTSKAMCSTTRSTRVTFAGQNGAVVKRTIRAVAACSKRPTKTKTK